VTRRLYLDMDGVLADFEHHVTASGIPGPHDYIQRPRDTWTGAEFERDERVRALMTDSLFWRNLPVMAGARELLAVAHHLAGPHLLVLTALPSNKNTRAMVAYEKVSWISRHLGFPPTNVITCLRSEKADHSGTGQVLVDDLRANCKEWNAAGGVGILFTDAPSAITQLLETFL
jgi:5'(3')-deoxyribonucleotidase